MNRKTIHIDVIRRAVADYMRSAGCSYCGDYKANEGHTKVLAELLGVSLKIDGSGYDFEQFRTKKLNEGKE